VNVFIYLKFLDQKLVHITDWSLTVKCNVEK